MLFKICIALILPLTLYARPGYFTPWGKDAELRISQEEKIPAQSLTVRCAEAIIHFHQNVLSPVDGPRSHFQPSSSNYMLDAIHKYGFLQGFIMGCDRLMRENGDACR